MESSRRELSVPLISARILHCAYYYASTMGVICFRLKRSQVEEGFVARSCCWYKGFCVAIRLVVCVFYIQNHCIDWNSFDLSHKKILVCLRMLGCLTFAVIIMVMQVLYGQTLIRLINRFLRIFRRVNALAAKQNGGFGGKRELTLLIFKTVSLLYELYSAFSALIFNFDVHLIMPVIWEIHISISTTLVSHICFVGYLSVGALYDRTNSYVRTELRQQLKDLQSYRGGQASRRRLQAAEERLDECLKIYDEIQRVARDFHKLFELVLTFILLCGFTNLALVAYYILLQIIITTHFWVFGGKLLLDLVVLIIAIHGSCCSSQRVRGLSVENYYVSERKDWHMKLEMFLNHLNYCEFKVRPLGLFEVSNGLILVFLSGMVTYLTYVLQYTAETV